MSPVKPPSNVLVTGASGFIAMHTCQILIQHGFHVVGTVRSSAKGDYLSKLLGEKFSYTIVEDIEQAGAFDDVIESGNFDGIVHMASPVTLKIEKVEKVVGPAVAGTKSILEATLKHGKTVKRIVMTASVATIAEPKDRPYTYNDKDWNNYSPSIVEEEGDNAPKLHIYRASKVWAEKPGWKFMKDNKSSIEFDLTTIHPPYVFGPMLQEIKGYDSINESNKILVNILLGHGGPSTNVNYVDCRDCARTHVLALRSSEAGGERFLISAGSFYPDEFRAILNEAGVSGVVPAEGSAAPPVMEYHDVSKAKKVLGMTFRTKKETLVDTFASFKEKIPEKFSA